MKFAPRARCTFVLPLLLLSAACSQSDAPSDKVGEAAEDLVDSVIETPSPDAEQPELGKYAPRNDCSKLAGANEFIRLLRTAIATRDTDVMVALAANDVKLGFGGVDGADNLRKSLDAGPGLWEQLDRATSMGCAVDEQGGIAMPWYWSQQIDGDPFETMIATGDDVIVHSGPNESSPRVATLNWDAVDRVEPAASPRNSAGKEEGDDAWVRIRLRSDESDPTQAKEGFVRASQVRSVVDYRLLANRRNDRWRVLALLAGD